MTDKMAQDPLQLAAELGMENPTPDLLDELQLAAATAYKHKSALQGFALTPTDEPAVVFNVAPSRT